MLGESLWWQRQRNVGNQSQCSKNSYHLLWNYASCGKIASGTYNKINGNGGLTGLARLHWRVGVEARAARAALLGGGCRGSEVLEGEHRAQTKFGPIMLFIQFILP
jgi:hypothetical protein